MCKIFMAYFGRPVLSPGTSFILSSHHTSDVVTSLLRKHVEGKLNFNYEVWLCAVVDLSAILWTVRALKNSVFTELDFILLIMYIIYFWEESSAGMFLVELMHMDRHMFAVNQWGCLTKYLLLNLQTHPTQSCFMSSIDVHTHYSYQVDYIHYSSFPVFLWKLIF